DTARLNRRVALGRGAVPEFQELLGKVSRIADDVPEWYQLNYLAANVADSAKDPESARRFYERVRVSISADPKQFALAQSLHRKVAALDAQLVATSDAAPDAGVTDASTLSARNRIKTYL